MWILGCHERQSRLTFIVPLNDFGNGSNERFLRFFNISFSPYLHPKKSPIGRLHSRSQFDFYINRLGISQFLIGIINTPAGEKFSSLSQSAHQEMILTIFVSIVALLLKINAASEIVFFFTDGNQLKFHKGSSSKSNRFYMCKYTYDEIVKSPQFSQDANSFLCQLEKKQEKLIPIKCHLKGNLVKKSDSVYQNLQNERLYISLSFLPGKASFLTEFENKHKYSVKLNCFLRNSSSPIEKASQLNPCRVGPFDLKFSQLLDLDAHHSFVDIFENIRGIFQILKAFHKEIDYIWHVPLELETVLVGCRDSVKGKVEIQILTPLLFAANIDYLMGKFLDFCKELFDKSTASEFEFFKSIGIEQEDQKEKCSSDKLENKNMC